MKKMRHTMPILLVAMFLLSGHAIAEAGETPPAEFRLANVFNSKMVLQCDKEVTVWGWAKPGASVTVTVSEDAKLIAAYQKQKTAPAASTEYKAILTYAEVNAPNFPVQTVTAKAAESGTWEVKLKAMPAGFKPKVLLAKSGDAAIALDDILVGEVWLCTGQSNMVMQTYYLEDLDGSREYPAIRHFREDKSWYRPADDLARQANWSPVKRRGITAIGFLFARYLQTHLKVPVGIMDVSRGGTTGDAWCSREALQSIKAPVIQDALKKYDAETALWETEASRQSILKKWEADVATKKTEHEATVAKAKAEGEKPPSAFRPPGKPGDAREAWSPPAGKFNISVYPIRKLPIRGVLFYQGENNCFGGGWTKYEHTLPKVIESFRAAYGDAELPFGIIGLPGWGTQPTDEENVMCSPNVLIRDIHTRTHNRMKQVGLVQTYDLGDGYIHPGDKRPVAERAARWALFFVYNKGVQHRGPKYTRMETDGSNIYLYFDYDPHLRSDARIEKYKPPWAVVPNPKPGGRAKIRGFVIAGKDRRWYPAETQQDMKRVALRVWSPFVAEPVAVRYAWGSGAEYANGTSGWDHPVPSFRTDDWPLPTLEEFTRNRDLAKYYAADRMIREALVNLPKNELAAARAAEKLKKGSQYKQQLLYKQAALESIVADMGKGWLASNINSKSPELEKRVVELEELIKAIKKEIAKVEE